MSQYNELDDLLKSMHKKINMTEKEKSEFQSKLNQNLNTRDNSIFIHKVKYRMALAVAGVIFFILFGPLVFSLLTDGDNFDTASLVHQGGSSSTDEEVEKIAQGYVKALETQDISAMVKYSDDIRFSSKEEQMEQYLTIDQNITNASVLSLTKINDNNYEVVIELSQDGETEELHFPINKKDGTWRILVGQDS